MTDQSSAVETAVNILLDSVPDDSAQEIIATYFFNKGVPFVVWSVEDFEAQIKANWAGAIPEGEWKNIARRALEQATDTLADTRNEEVMDQFIDGVWGDFLNTEEQPINFKLRLRNPKNRGEVRAMFHTGVNGGDAHSDFVEANPDYRGWPVVTISEA